MKTRVIAALLLLVILFNLTSPVVVLANNGKAKGKDKQETIKTNKGQQKNLDKNVIPTPTVLGSSSESFDFEVISLDIAPTLSVNKQNKSSISIKNTSSFNWTKQEVKISYHWVDENGEYEIYRGDTTSLLKNVNQNQPTEDKQTISIKAPSIPGNFKLRIDLLKDGTWFTDKTSYRYEKEVQIVGNLSIASFESDMLLNDGAEFANNESLKATVTPYTRQPESENAAFIYDYVQFTDSPESEILNGTAKWSKWQLLSDAWNTSDVHFNIKDTSVGVKKIFMRYRAIKKQSDLPAPDQPGGQAGATPESYGSAMYHYGRSEKTSDIYYVDEIFFDNVPPTGTISINNGAVSTTSRTGSLQITATDTIDGIEGSGLNGMRLANNCDVNNPENNNWSEWEKVGDKEDFDLGSGSIMTVCVQFRDKAGNIALFSDSINFIVYNYVTSPSSTTGIFGLSIGYGIGTPEDPYASLTSDNLTDARTEFNRFMDCCWEKSIEIAGWYIPPSRITYVNRTDDDILQVFGVAVRKHHPVTVTVNNQYGENCYLFGCTIEWQNPNIIERRTLGNVEVQLINQNGEVIDKIWNDTSNGRYEFNLKIGEDIQDGDELHTKVVTWIDHYFYDLKYWWNTTEDVVFEANNLWSGDSEWIGVPQFDDDALMQQITDRYGYKFEERGFEWSEEELVWLLELLEYLKVEDPRLLDTYLSLLLRDSSEEECDTTKFEEVGCAFISTIIFIRDKYTTLADNEFGRYGVIDRETAFKITITHELAHTYHHKYPSNLDAFDDISWETPERGRDDATNCDFITSYAVFGNSEDYAESWAVKLILPDLYTQYFESKVTCITREPYETSPLHEKFVFFN